MVRIWTIIIGILLLAAASCGGGGATRAPATGNGGSPPTVSPDPADTSTTLSAELSRLDAMAAPDGVDQNTWLTLKASLRQAMAALMPSKVTQSPPAGPHSVVDDLTFVRDEEEAGWLTWSFQLYADYNLDGVVDADDLSPIAENYLQVVGEESPVAMRLDTSGNGVVDLADITAIAQYYGSELAGFFVRSYTDEAEFTELSAVLREQALNLEDPQFLADGILLYRFQYEDSPEWVDLAVVAFDGDGATGDLSNVVEYQPVRIVSVSVPGGKVGDTGTATAVVEGAEPITYEWILTNGLSPSRSSDPSVEVELVSQGMFNGRLNVSNLFGADTEFFTVTIGVPPTITSVTPDTAVCGERVEFSATVTGTAPFTYSWNFGSSAFPRTSPLERPSVEFDEDGTHSVRLQVANEYGSDSYLLDVTAGFPPVIVAISPDKGALGSSVNFTASVVGTAPYSYLWDFKHMGDPTLSGDVNPVVNLTDAGDYQCTLTVTNPYGEYRRWFSFHVGRPPTINQILWTTTTGNLVCWFFADVNGDFPMSWTWTFDMFAPDPPLQLDMMPAVFLLPGELGIYDCSLEAVNDYGSDLFEFEYEITYVEPPPM